MNILMFTGMSTLLPLYHLKNGCKEEVSSKEYVPLVFAIPALLDAISSALQFMGLILISASSYNMLKMLSMVFVVILSLILLQRSYTWT